MSRLGKLPIKFNSNIQVNLEGSELSCQGPKGKLHLNIHPSVEIKIENNEIKVAPRDLDAKNAKAFWGLMWSLIRNMIEGVSVGFVRKLEVNGVGYRVTVAGDKLNLNLGFSHPIEFKVPEGVKASVEGNIISLEGADKALVGETAAKIRKLRKPEPYKGKGIKYLEEVIRRKAGKAAAKTK